MCTAVLSFDPSSPVPVLLAGIRDEFTDRSWAPPAAHWPVWPRLVGGRDLRAGGTWLAVDPAAPRVATVLNGPGREADPRLRRSRGALPLLAAATGVLTGPDALDGADGLRRFDPFHLLCAEPGRARLWSWDGERLARTDLAPGLHVIVNSGLEGGGPPPGTARHAEAAAHMAARIAHFRPRLLAVPRPLPGPGGDTAAAWGGWLGLMDGDGLDPADPRALVLRRDLGGGRVWGTTSVGLVALPADPARGVRYDFSGSPGTPLAWTVVPTGPAVPKNP